MLDTKFLSDLKLCFDEHSIFRPRINLWYLFVQDMLRELHERRCAHHATSPCLEMTRIVPLQPQTFWHGFFDMLPWTKNRIEWIATELAPLIPMSDYSTIYTGKRIEDVRNLSFELQKKMTQSAYAHGKRNIAIDSLYRVSRKVNRKMRRSPSLKHSIAQCVICMSVPHSEIKAALDAEKAAKKKQRKVKKKPSVSGRASPTGLRRLRRRSCEASVLPVSSA